MIVVTWQSTDSSELDPCCLLAFDPLLFERTSVFLFNYWREVLDVNGLVLLHTFPDARILQTRVVVSDFEFSREAAAARINFGTGIAKPCRAAVAFAAEQVGQTLARLASPVWCLNSLFMSRARRRDVPSAARAT